MDVTAKAGRGVGEFCGVIGICQATYYNMPPELRPHSITLLGRRIIIEDPDAYLARIAKAQAASAEAAA